MSFSSWRGVVGMVNPTMRPGMTEEVCRLLPEGIGLIPLFLNIRRGTEDEFETMMPHYEKLVALLAEQNCDIIHPNGAPPFMVHGFKGEAKIIADDGDNSGEDGITIINRNDNRSSAAAVIK